MFRLELLFLMQLVVGILLLVLLHKISRMKKQVDDIIKEVKDYVSFVTEEEVVDTFDSEKGQYEEKARRVSTKRFSQGEQNSLIQSVLGDYFP